MTKKQKIDKIIEIFSQTMPNPQTELNYRSPYELTVAVILSAQCTDKRVNQITPNFFKIFPDFETLAKSNHSQIYELIKSCSYPNNKAKNLLALAQAVVTNYNGTIPENIEELENLPGIGRKSANVIASVAFQKPALAVDTHVFRVTQRLGLTTNAKNPKQAELQLLEIVPPNFIHNFHHWIILHGRYVCKARNPNCPDCQIKEICNFYTKQ